MDHSGAVGPRYVGRRMGNVVRRYLQYHTLRNMNTKKTTSGKRAKEAILRSALGERLWKRREQLRKHVLESDYWAVIQRVWP